MSELLIGMVTVSDRASRGEYQDLGGPALEQFLRDHVTSPWQPHGRLIPDERDRIESTLIELCDDVGCGWIITTGGTGPAPRDVTPDATEAVCDRMLPGFGERIRAISLPITPHAILSRAGAGSRGRSLIVNLPGSPKAIGECLSALLPTLPHCLELLGNAGVTLRSDD